MMEVRHYVVTTVAAGDSRQQIADALADLDVAWIITGPYRDLDEMQELPTRLKYVRAKIMDQMGEEE